MHAYPAGGSTGDDDAFAALCEEHRARLVAFCTRRLGTRHDAEDAAHEVFLRAHRALPRFDGSVDAWPWLRTIAARICTDMQRKAARASSAAVVDKPVTEDVHEQMAARLRAEIVDDALDRLSPRYRSPLVLREFGGWSYDEIARAQGRSRASVRSILTRGRRRLGNHVETVARSRNEWPLPAALQPLRRLREEFRSLRSALERSSNALGMAVELSAVAARMMIAAPAIAGVASLASPVEAAHSLPSQPRPAVSAPNATRPAAGATELETRPTALGSATATAANTAKAATSIAREPKTLAAVEATAPSSGVAGSDVRATGFVRDTGTHLQIGTDESAPVPGWEGERKASVSCMKDAARTAACNVVRPVLRQLPPT